MEHLIYLNLSRGNYSHKTLKSILLCLFIPSITRTTQISSLLYPLLPQTGEVFKRSEVSRTESDFLLTNTLNNSQLLIFHFKKWLNYHGKVQKWQQNYKAAAASRAFTEFTASNLLRFK